MLRTRISPRARFAVAAVALATTGSLAPAAVPVAQAADPTVLPAAPTPTPTEPAAQPRPRPTSFRFHVATFNVLGSQHTRGPGGYGPGTARARTTAALIQRKHIDVIGLQEVQRDQLRVLRNRLDGYRIWPGTRLGNQGVRLQIAYRRKQFRMVDHGTINTAFDHQVRPIPWVKLRNRATGRTFFAVDIHNSPQGQEAERDRATAHEIDLIRRLRRSHLPVFVMGDMNEKQEWFCKVVSRTDLRASNGGHATRRSCSPPARRLRIDWIMGGRRIDFSHYREDNGRRVRRTSDHEFIHAQVRVRPRR